MKRRNLILPLFIIIIILISFSFQASALSRQMRDFIQEGKEVRIRLIEDEDEVSLTPVNDITGRNIDIAGETFKLEADKKYSIKVMDGRSYSWRPQVFATINEDRAEEIKEEVRKDGYEQAFILEEEDWYKVQVGDFEDRNKGKELVKKLREDGWSCWLVSHKTEEKEPQIGIYDARNELVFSGRDFYLEGEVYLEDELHEGQFDFLYTSESIRIYHSTDFNNILRGVLAEKNTANLRPESREESLKAQAVAERSRLLYHILDDTRGFIEKDKYKGLNDVDRKIKDAVISTEGRVIYHEDKPIKALTHQNSGGYTASAGSFGEDSLPYLKAREDTYSLQDYKQYIYWNKDWMEEDLIKRFHEFFNREVNGIRDIKIRERSQSERVLKVEILTDFGSYTLEDEKILDFFAIESSLFQFKKDFNDAGYLESIQLLGEGQGHGLGLSRDGARVMAGRDYNYQEIIDFYYPETEIKNLIKEKHIETKVDARVRSGLTYKEIRLMDWNGPRIINTLEMDLDRASLDLQSFMAGDRISGLADLTDVVKEKDALAGINGGFFDYNGNPLGLFITDDKIVSESLKNRTALGYTDSGDVLIDNISWHGELKNKKQQKTLKVEGANRPPADDTVIFNKYYGDRTPGFSAGSAHMTVIDNEVIGIDNNLSLEGVLIPEDGFVVQTDKGIDEFDDFRPGDKVEFHNKFNNEKWNNNHIKMAVGGGPLILKDCSVDIHGKEE